MSDRVFSGRDVAEALAQAALALGVRAERLRFVVLEAGTQGGLGLKPTPARVAVLLAGSVGGAPATPPARGEPSRPGRATEPERATEPQRTTSEPGVVDAPAAIEAVLASLARAAGAELRGEVSATAETLEVRLRGRDVAPFLLDSAERGVLDALEHLLYGMFAHRVFPLRLRIDCEGGREHRERGVRAKALALAAEVLADGQLRTTEPLNSYERRLVHMAVADVAGVITYSVGGGPDRRVTIALAQASLGGEVH